MRGEAPTFEGGTGGAKTPSLEIPNSVTGSVMFFVVFPAIYHHPKPLFSQQVPLRLLG